MKLVFVYGPPASGKLTVSTELAKLTGFKLFDNHKTVEMVRQLFPFEDPALNIIRRRLQTDFRLTMFEEAAKANVSFITTCAIAGPQHFAYYRQTRQLVAKHGGRVLFVQLKPGIEAMLERVTEDSRKGLKIESQEHLRRLLQAEPELFDTFPDVQHLQLDNSRLEALESATAIRDYYHL